MSTREAVIVGWAHSPFGKLAEYEDIEALMGAVGSTALQHAGVGAEDVDNIAVGVLNCGFSKQSFEGALPSVAIPGLETTPSMRTENACATGSAAVLCRRINVDRGQAGPRIGARGRGREDDRDRQGEEIGEILLLKAAATCKEEGEHARAVSPACSAASPSSYFQRHGDQSRRPGDAIAAKNHTNGCAQPLCPAAQGPRRYEFCQQRCPTRTRSWPGR